MNIANIPLALPDQCLESLLAVVWKENGTACALRESIARHLNGSFKLHFVSLGGGLKVFKYLEGAGYRTASDFLEAHTYLPLFRPFSNPRTYQATLEQSVAGRYVSLSGTLGALDRPCVKSARWYCAACAEDDFARRGFGYARRVHQVLGVDVCPAHGEPLFRPRLASSSAPGAYGLLLTPADFAHPVVSTSLNEPRASIRPFRLRFAKFVAATLDGSLMPLGPKQRRALLSERIRSMPELHGDPHSLPHRFEKIVESVAPRDWLERIGYDQHNGLTSRWPAAFMAGVAYQEHLFVGLLCAAVLFDDADDYNFFAVRHLDADPGNLEQGRRLVPARGRSKLVLSLPLMRALLGSSLDQVARKFGVPPSAVIGLVCTYPTLRERRERAIIRRGVAHYKRVLLHYVESNGDKATRRGARRAHMRGFAWVYRYAPAYLDALLPRRKGRPPWKGDLLPTEPLKRCPHGMRAT